MMFVDDHVPAHVHVFGSGRAKVLIRDANGDSLILESEGMTRAAERRILEQVRAQQLMPLRRWKELHG